MGERGGRDYFFKKKRGGRASVTLMRVKYEATGRGGGKKSGKKKRGKKNLEKKKVRSLEKKTEVEEGNSFWFACLFFLKKE